MTSQEIRAEVEQDLFDMGYHRVGDLFVKGETKCYVRVINRARADGGSRAEIVEVDEAFE